MKDQMKQKGITLIALVITIIVLLILAGITISTLIGENGILSYAKLAAYKTKREQALEKVKIEVAGSYRENAKIDYTALNENLKNIEGLTYGGEKLSDSNQITSLPVTVGLDGFDILIEENGEVSIVEQEEIIEDVENYVLKWNCGYNANNSGNSTSSIIAFLVKNEDNEEYTLIFKGKGKMDSAVRWNIDNISCGWTRGDSESEKIENYKSKITKVIISEGITELSDDDLTFYHCDNISEIEFAKSVIIRRRKSVEYAKKWLENQRKINSLVIVNNSIVDGWNCSDIVTIPKNIDIICDEAFFSNKKIKDVKTGDSVEIIGNSAFENCTALKTFYYSKNLKSIGKRAFNMCTSLENIDLPEGLETIGQLRI